MTPAAALAATPKDTLVIATSIDDIVSIDPAEAFEFSGGDLLQNTYDRLVELDPKDLSAGYVPGLAASWKVSEDGLTYTFTMREGVKFHSGNPFTAEDAAFRSEEHTSELQSLMRISYAVFCLKKKKT